MLIEGLSRLIAIICLVILTPVFLIISIFSLLFQGPPVFFTQERVGHNFQLFKLYKFRSMSNSTSTAGITVTGDERVTWWGKFLRKFKIDELPQLLNIVKGEMSFTGPRPEIPAYTNQYDFSYLKTVKPGLTDFSSIIFRNEEQTLKKAGGLAGYEELLPVKLSLNKLYVDNRTIAIDIFLVVLTGLSLVAPVCARSLVLSLFIDRFDRQLALQLKHLD